MRSTCRICKAAVQELYSLGEQYLSDFVDIGQVTAGPKLPITLQLCPDCGLVQAQATPPPELLYREHYWYRSGVTATMQAALADVTAAIQSRVDLQRGDIVLDIGSNDGTLLRTYPEHLLRLGVEPAKNFADCYRGLELLREFWPVQGVLPYNKAKAVTACGMFYDLDDPNLFVRGVADVLHPDGIFVAQLMCLKQMMQANDVGNLCHEHLEFYSLGSLQRLYQQNGLAIVDIEENTVNGGSYRIYAKLSGARIEPAAMSRITTQHLEESILGLNQRYVHLDWIETCISNLKQASNFVREAVTARETVWVYGASTKGNVLLQAMGLNACLIQGASDRSPEKWGKYTAGTGIRIFSEEDVRAVNPDYFLVLPYAFLSEFMEREKEWRAKGGKFIVPLPKFRVL